MHYQVDPPSSKAPHSTIKPTVAPIIVYRLPHKSVTTLRLMWPSIPEASGREHEPIFMRFVVPQPEQPVALLLKCNVSRSSLLNWFRPLCQSRMPLCATTSDLNSLSIVVTTTPDDDDMKRSYSVIFFAQ